jgi:glycosyltransferase involved in cell wall biosynthesis
MILSLPFYTIEKLFFPFDANWSWYLSAQRSALQLAKRFKADIVYSTGGPITAHIAAEKVNRRMGVPWIAEFQDPLRTGVSTRNRRESGMHSRIEEMVAAKADSVIFLTRALRDTTLSRMEFKGEVQTIYPGSPPIGETNQRDLSLNKERMELVHIGTLSSTRNLKGLLKGLDHLKENKPRILDRVSVHQYGYADGKVVSSVGNNPYHIRLMGKVSHFDALNAMVNANVLLLVQDWSPISSETIPSKVYEYLHSGRPILGLVYRNPELKRMLERYGHMVVEVDDTQATAEAVEILFDRWENNCLTEGVRPSDLTVENAVARLEDLAKSIGRESEFGL